MIPRRAAATPTLSSVANEVGTNVPTLLHKVEAFADQVWEDKKQLHNKHGVYNPAKGFTSSNGVLDFKWKPTLDMAEVLSRAASVNFESLRKKLASDPASREELAKVIGNSAAKWASRLDSWVGWLNNLLHKHLADAMDMQEAVAEDLGMGELMGHSQKWLVHPTRVRRSLYMSAKTESNFVNLSFEIQLDMAPNPGARSASLPKKTCAQFNQEYRRWVAGEMDNHDHVVAAAKERWLAAATLSEAEGAEVDAARQDILRYFRTHGWRLGRDSQQRPTVTHPTGHIQIWLYPTGDVYVAAGDVPDLRNAHHIPAGVLKFRDPHKFYQEVMKTVAIQDPEVLRARSAGVEAMEHDTQEALDKYLKEHPNADRSRHKVKTAPANPHEVAAVHEKHKPPADIAKHLSRMPTKFLSAEQRDAEQKKLVKDLLADPRQTVESLRKLHHDAHEYYLGGSFRGPVEDEHDAEGQARAQAQNLWRATADAMKAKVNQGKKTADIVERLAAQVEDRAAREFPSEKAKREYLKEHPRADPANHSVAPADSSKRDRSQDIQKGTKADRVHQTLAPRGLAEFYDAKLPQVTHDNKKRILRDNAALVKIVRAADDMTLMEVKEAARDAANYMTQLHARVQDVQRAGGGEDPELKKAFVQAHAVWFAFKEMERYKNGDPNSYVNQSREVDRVQKAKEQKTGHSEEVMSHKSALEELTTMAGLTSRFEEGKPADPTKDMSDEDAQKWEDMNDEYGDKFKAAKVNPRSPAGTVVVLKANPAARALYTGLPPNGTQGKVSPVAMPGGKKTYLPGPGGGLIYVAFDNGEFMGVSPNDLDEADEARTAAEVGAGSPREIRAFRSRFSRFEEGKPADPTKDMSEEDAQEWEDNTEKYKDKFKAAGFAEGEHADPTENMSDADAEKWDEMHDKYEDKFKKEAASFRSFVEAALGDGAASPEVELERLSRFERGKPADPTKHMSDEDAEKWQSMNDKYGDKFKAAADREETFATAVRAIHDAAVRAAKQAFKSAPDVGRFFRVRADQRGCEVSRILGGTLSLMGATSPAGRAASAEACGLYGLPATTVQAGLQACAQLEAAAGRVAAGMLRGMDPADQPGVVAQMRSYARRNRCLRARLLATCAPPIGP